jgi:hypothetical protein
MGISNDTLWIGLCVFIIIFLILREINCWYWKINQSIALLTEIRDLLIKQSNSNGHDDVTPEETQLVRVKLLKT